MFAPLIQPQLEDDNFADINFSKNIECLIPSTEMFVNFRTNGLQTRKLCHIYAEKLDFKELIQLRLCEKSDQRRMYISTVDSGSFQELKQDQSLHVTFSGFIENLVKILQDCQSGKLVIHMVHLTQNNSGIVEIANDIISMDYKLQFVEMRTFKNLIHLSLSCRQAPLNIVLFYMNNILNALQKVSTVKDNTLQQQQHEINAHLRRIEQQNNEISKLRNNLIESTNTLSQRHADELQQMQDNIRKVSEQRNNDNERSRKTITALQTQLEKINTEKSALQAEKIQDNRHIETLNEELANSKANNSNLKEQNDKLHTEIAALKNMERKQEMHLNDARKQLLELQDKVKKYGKVKADIIAELEAEKNISQTKRHALEMASEEISKANEIIVKQTQEITKLKRTICWRTEVALQQEKAINEKDALIKIYTDEIKELRQTVDILRTEIPKELDSLRKISDTLEKKYQERINALTEQLKPVGKENYPLKTKLYTTHKRN